MIRHNFYIYQGSNNNHPIGIKNSYFFAFEANIIPSINNTTLTMTGVQLAELTATSIPKKLNDSELPRACTPKITVPTIPMINRTIPVIFIRLIFIKV